VYSQADSGTVQTGVAIGEPEMHDEEGAAGEDELQQAGGPYLSSYMRGGDKEAGEDEAAASKISVGLRDHDDYWPKRPKLTVSYKLPNSFFEF